MGHEKTTETAEDREKRVEYLPKPGEAVTDAVNSAISLSREKRRPVTIKFNEATTVNVSGSSQPHKIVSKINKEMKRQH
jgi:hypothetical protein